MIPRSLVTDTHPLLNYFGDNRQKLSKKARLAFDAAMSGETTIVVPTFVIIETSQLLRKGKIQLSSPLHEWMGNLFSSMSFVPCPLDVAVALRYDLMGFTSDPADALIVAAALELELPLITNDSHIHATKPCLLYWD